LQIFKAKKKNLNKKTQKSDIEKVDKEIEQKSKEIEVEEKKLR
jgi:hypothetical protein